MNVPDPAPSPPTEEEVAASGDRPPRLPFVLSVGVTGHRKDALPADSLPRLETRLRNALQLLIDGVAAIHAQEGSHYLPEPAKLRFITPLAGGADQLAAGVALELGFELLAILPFSRERYRRELCDDQARERFDELLARSSCVLELPGERQQAIDAYVMTGRATVAHCDLLLAVWDGEAPRGRGGTGEVVELAVVEGTPVIHVPVEAAEPDRLLWSAFDPAVVTHRVERTTERPLDELHLAHVLSALFSPPADPQERHFLSIFLRERLRRIQPRIEYPLLLAAAGVARFSTRKIREDNCAADIREEWVRFRQCCADANQIQAPLDLLESSYSWADRLAGHFAQTYRSGHIFNFVFGGLAVCLGLSANIFPGSMFELAIVEGIITAGIIVNTRIGVKNEWHRRWLDYRQLAERLRPMRSFKLLGLAAPDPPGTPNNPVPRRWIEWYANGIWRALGCPAGAIDGQRAEQLGRAVATYEIGPQVAYHERNSGQVELLDRRLEKIAGALFLATLIVAVVVVVGLLIAPDWITEYDDYFTFVEAGFPALGTAVFGIRFQGDFGGSAVRSQATANALRQIESELMQGTSLVRASDLTEQAGRIMLGDLDEWRLVNEQQDLDLV